MVNTNYTPMTANYPRLKTDTFFVDYENTYRYTGAADEIIRYIEDFQLLRPELWARFVRQFQTDADDIDHGWRGEYWGKMMRGACFTYSYTKNPELYNILAATVRDMMSSADAAGRISTYGKDTEFDGWDIWSRKYVMLGMQYFLEICSEEAFQKEIIASICAQADCIMDRIGDPEDGKLLITKATRHWRGLNSASLLEPIVRLYSLTGQQRYFDFATYIVNTGGTDVANIFDLAYEDQLLPYQYPVTKAYEMTPCFEGLLEYYRITGNARYKTAVIRYADRVLESDFTVIGSSGCTHELFDHSTVRQANTTNGEILQETCVTVTLMKFFHQLALLTGDAKYSDAMEISLYNAYLGAINTEKCHEPTLPVQHPDWVIEPLPFDSYAPLTAGHRGTKIGGLMIMADKHYYGCCACIGAVGTGLMARMSTLQAQDGIVLNLYFDGTVHTTTPSGIPLTVKTVTKYPAEGTVRFALTLEKPEAFTVYLRNPAWSKNTTLCVNGRHISAVNGYISIQRRWQTGDVIEMELDMRTRAIRPIPYDHDILMNKVVWLSHYIVPVYDVEDPMAKHHIALLRGPVVLAQESRLGYRLSDPVDVLVEADGTVKVMEPAQKLAPYPNLIELCVPLTDGTQMHVTDYASAGKYWSPDVQLAAWMLTK